MKKMFRTLFLSAAVSAALVSCNNGDYIAAPDANSNPAVNPITPLEASEYNWYNGDEQLAAEINGQYWSADYVTFHLDTSGANVITGHKTDSKIMLQLYLRDVWTDNLYSMEWDDLGRYGCCINADPITGGAFYSYLSNSGGLKITSNDTGKITGMFHFLGVDAEGKTMSVLKGTMNIDKP